MNKIKEYFSSKRVSNSLLGGINNPKITWLQINNMLEDEEEKSYFRIGAAIDCKLTNLEEWDNEFVVVDSIRPTGMMLKFVDSLPEGINEFSGADSYREAYENSGYKANINTVIKWFWENRENYKYYQDKFLDLGDKYLLTKDEVDLVNSCVSVILENEYTRRFFIGDEVGIERLLQVPIYFSINNIECKALLDGVLIDHINKIIQPFDLKSTAKSVYQFPTSFWQFGYYRQAAFYTIALEHFIKERSKYDLKPISDYTILPFKFIVVEKKVTNLSPALIYTTSQKDIEVGLYGGVIKDTKNKVKGIYELLEDYTWHCQTNLWLLPREAYLNNGELTLDIFI